MRTIRSVLPLLCMLGCGGRPGEPNDCRNANEDEAIRGLDMGYLEPYSSIDNGDAFETIVGGQGARMFQMALRINGADAPSCLGQTTTLVDANGEQIGQLDVPLKTNKVGNFRFTDAMPIPIDVHSETTAEITVTTKAHGKTIKRVLIRDVDTGDYTYYR